MERGKVLAHRMLQRRLLAVRARIVQVALHVLLRSCFSNLGSIYLTTIACQEERPQHVLQGRRGSQGRHPALHLTHLVVVSEYPVLTWCGLGA